MSAEEEFSFSFKALTVGVGEVGVWALCGVCRMRLSSGEVCLCVALWPSRCKLPQPLLRTPTPFPGATVECSCCEKQSSSLKSRALLFVSTWAILAC